MKHNSTSIYIARQPIIDEDGALWAYELLFRSCGSPNQANITDSFSATAQVLRNSVSMGFGTIVGDKKAFFNCDRNIIRSDILSIIDSNVFVLEILETVIIDDEIIEAIRILKEENGFVIALDDFIYNEDNIVRAEKIMKYIDIIKVDLLQTPKDLWEISASYINGCGKISLAEKVETAEDFKLCKKYGFDYFQGYFFAKPHIVRGAKIDANSATAIDLLQFVRNDGDHKGIVTRFKKSPEMTLSLLRLINSAAFGLRFPVSSILHAITMFGTKNLERWLMLLLYAQRGTNTIIEPLSPLFENASMRASMMENIARIYCGEKDEILPEKAYFVGLVSRADALFGIRMEEVLEEFNFDKEINSAILEGEGTLGKMLCLISAYENDALEEVDSLIADLKISPEKFSKSIINSFKKTMV